MSVTITDYDQEMKTSQGEAPPAYNGGGYDQSAPPPANQAYGGGPQTVVVAAQPQHNVTIIQQGAVARPSNYLGLAIFTTICCNLICGKYMTLILTP